MSILVSYPSNIFSNLNDISTIIISAAIHPLWVTSLLVCNRGPAPMRFNMKKSRLNGLELELPVYVASTNNLNAIYNNGINGVGATLINNGPLAPFILDGTAVPLNSRVLIKNQTNAFQNGIYDLNVVGNNSTAWVLSRSLDYDTVKKIQPGDIVFVLQGLINRDTRWNQTSVVTTIGVNPITFVPETFESIYLINELEISPFATIDIIDTTGVIQLNFSRFPYISDSLSCFSNGYTQVFDCDVNYARLNELP